jgi:hypothetical protein
VQLVKLDFIQLWAKARGQAKLQFLLKELQMLSLPTEIMPIVNAFAPVFSERVWDWVQVMIVGAILAPGKRTVSAVLRVMGRSQDEQFQNYHRVLNRAVWSELAVSRVLLSRLVAAFGSGPLVIGADETLERRLGPKIRHKGMFRDAVRSSKQYPVISPGLRWVSMMLLAQVPWGQRVWGLPFLTVLAPSQKTNEALGKRHKTSTEWVRQMITQVRRWYPARGLVLVVDGGLSAIWLAQRCVDLGITFVSRLRLDAQLYDPVDPQRPTRPGPKPTKGPRQQKLAARLTDPATNWSRQQVAWYGGVQREMDLATGTALWHRPGYAPLPIRWVLVRDPLGKLSPAAFFSTATETSPRHILQWVIMRWSVEVTFQEVRTHLGFETQRQWSDKAIARTTPALLGLFSLVTLLAHHLSRHHPLPARSAAWYVKTHPTFSDAIAFVRRYLWTHVEFVHSPVPTTVVQLPTAVLAGLVDTLCFVI